MADGDGVVLKVNRTPLEAKNFTSTQAIESSKEDRNLKVCPFCGGKEPFYFVTIIEAANKAIFLRPFNLVCGICWYQINFMAYFSALWILA